MKKKLPVIFGVLITVIIAVLYSFTDKTHRLYDNNVNTAVYTSIGVLSEGNVVTQSFLCQENTLDGFIIKSDVSGNYGDVKVAVRVLDAETGQVLAEGGEAGNKIRARSQHYYKISPLTDVKGKRLILEVTENGSTGTDGICFFYQPNSNSDGQFIANGTAVEGTLVMKTVTERFVWETFFVMLGAEWFIWGFLWFLYRLFK